MSRPRRREVVHLFLDRFSIDESGGGASERVGQRADADQGQADAEHHLAAHDRREPQPEAVEVADHEQRCDQDDLGYEQRCASRR